MNKTQHTNSSVKTNNQTFLNLFVVTSMTILLFLENWFFGHNDTISIFLIALSTIIMFMFISKLQQANRKTMRVNAKKDSLLYNILSKSSLITYIISFIVSFISSFSLVVISKGMILNHGILPVISVVLIGGFFTLNVIGSNEVSNEHIDENLKSEISTNINLLLLLIYVSFSFNFILTLFLSAHDVFVFINNNITLDNFDEYVIAHKVIKNGSNDASRVFIHIYMLMDNIKMAITNIIFEKILHVNKDDWFFASYIIILFLNFIKMIGFSFGFVFLLKGLQILLQKFTFINKIEILISNFIEKIKKTTAKNKQTKVEE